MRIVAIALLVAGSLAAADPVPIGKLEKIGARLLHLHCEGKGTPVVLFVNGVPRFSLHFMLAQAEAAKSNRACIYDRAGEAWTPAASADPPAAEATLDELDAVVRHVGGGKPVILAGHSFGGVIARAYQRRRPQRVAGLVLIDTVPLELAKMRVNGHDKPMADLTEDDLRKIGAAARQRPRPPVTEPKVESPFDRLPSAMHESHVWAMKKWQDYVAKVDPADAIRYQAQMYRAIEGATLARVPLAVLARAKSEEESSSWIAAQKAIAAQSGKSVFLRAVGSGHDIQLERPALVAEAIRGVSGR